MSNQPVAAATVEKKRGLRFDPTINAGHIITAFTFLLMGLGAYATLATRVTVIETTYAAHVKSNEDAAKRQDDAVNSLRGDIKEVQNAVQALTIAVAKEGRK